MRKPDESLDDFKVKAAPKAVEPPPAGQLGFTGEVEVLRPLAQSERVAKQAVAVVDPISRPAQHQLSWFHRSLAVGGALAVMVIILASAIIIGIYDETENTGGDLVKTVDTSSDMPIDQPPIDTPVATDEPLIPDMDSPTSSLFGEVGAIDTTVRRRSARPRVHVVAYRVGRYHRRSRPATPKFIPTTLVIYPENGEIKTRIEPWLTAAYKRPHFLNN